MVTYRIITKCLVISSVFCQNSYSNCDWSAVIILKIPHFNSCFCSFWIKRAIAISRKDCLYIWFVWRTEGKGMWSSRIVWYHARIDWFGRIRTRDITLFSCCRIVVSRGFIHTTIDNSIFEEVCPSCWDRLISDKSLGWHRRNINDVILVINIINSNRWSGKYIVGKNVWYWRCFSVRTSFGDIKYRWSRNTVTWRNIDTMPDISFGWKVRSSYGGPIYDHSWSEIVRRNSINFNAGWFIYVYTM